MKNNNKFTKDKLHNWIVMCDICGTPWWNTQVTKLDNYTGRGGLLVCPRDADKIDYSLVPYKIPAEKSPAYVRTNNYLATSYPGTFGAFDYSKYDPMGVTPQQIVLAQTPINQVTTTCNTYNTNCNGTV